MKNQKGFTIIEALITLAVMSIGALALLSMTLDSLKSQVNVNSLSDWTNLQSRITVFISNPNLCPSVIKNVNGTALSLASENITQGAVLSSGDTVTQLYYSFISTTPNPNEYTYQLTMAGTKNSFSAGPAPLRPFKIAFTATLDSSNNVVACSLLTVSPQVSCSALGGTWQQQGTSGNYKCSLN